MVIAVGAGAGSRVLPDLRAAKCSGDWRKTLALGAPSPYVSRSGTPSREMTQTRPHMLLRVRRTIVRGSWPTSSSNRIGSEPSPRVSNGAQVAL